MGSCRSDRLVRRAGVIGSVFAALLVPPATRAQPSVRVRSGTHLELHSQPAPHALVLHGTLLDDLDGPLEGRRLRVTVRESGATADAGRVYSLRSSRDGGFVLELPETSRGYEVRAEFEGDAHDTATARDLTIDPAKEDVRLRFVTPREQRIELDGAEHEVLVRLTAPHGTAGLDVRIENERGERVAQGRSDADGEFRTRVAARAFGPPAWGRLAASTPGDARRSPARVELAILRFQPTVLSLRIELGETPDTIRWVGSLHAGSTGLGHKAVALFDGEHHLATVLTDANGNFRYVMHAKRAPETKNSRIAARARFTSDVEWFGSSVSPTLQVEPAASARFGSLWMLIPIAISAALVYFLWRREPRAAGRGQETMLSRSSAGIHAAAIGAQRTPVVSRISGDVLDATLARAIAHAQLELQPANNAAPIVLSLSDAGHFESNDLPRGRVRVRIHAAGFRSVEGEITIPHRGEWLEMKVLLASLRTEAVSAYKPAALQAMSSPEQWEHSTLRETVEQASAAGRAPESFVQLTDRVERVAYARAVPSEHDIDEIDRATRDLMRSEDPSTHS